MFEITLSEKTLNQETIQTVNARDLHRELGVGRDFTNWIKARIEKYDFIENQDFIILAKTGEKGRPLKEYHISIDMAKELSMLERNAKGKEARRYFIMMEKKAKALPAMSPAEVLAGVANQLVSVDNRVTSLEDKVSKLAIPKPKKKSIYCQKGYYTISAMYHQLKEANHPISYSSIEKLLKYYEDKIRKADNCYNKEDVDLVLQEVVRNAYAISESRMLDPISEISFKANWVESYVTKHPA
jgi:phage anti-repressor protein